MKYGSSWLKDLFSPKDDVEWLTNLLKKEEITQDQYEWLLELFEKKPYMDGDYADSWWKSIFTSTYKGSFDEDSIPSFIKEHSLLTKEREESKNAAPLII